MAEEIQKKSVTDVAKESYNNGVVLGVQNGKAVSYGVNEEGGLVTTDKVNENLTFGEVKEGDNNVVSGGELFDKNKQTAFYIDGYISKDNGEIVSSSTYSVSKYLKIKNKENLVVTGFSGVTNAVALISFFDSNFNYLGYANAPTHGAVPNYKVPPTAIPINAVYGVISKQRAQPQELKGFDLQYCIDNKDFIILYNKKTLVNPLLLKSTDYFNNIGYFNKTTGRPQDTRSSSYRYTNFLFITDVNNLVVTGFSGVANNAALALFFDSNFNYLGYANAPTHGNVTKYKIPPTDIPSGSMYVVFNRNTGVEVYTQGVSYDYSMPLLLKYIDGKKTFLTDVLMNRSSRPNVDNGGEIKLINYIGNTQNIHPKVLYFKDGFNGYKYWMAYTPYPGGNVLYENPCISASNDGKNWVTPSGLVNPLEEAPRTSERPLAYNSDTHLVYNSDTLQIECWWRSYDPTTAEVCIKRRVSLNGIDWQPTQIIFDWYKHAQVSQAVNYEDGKYKYWACVSGVVQYCESTDNTPFTFGAFTTLPIDFTGLNAWHMDVVKRNFGYEFVIQCWVIPGGTNNTSDLYYVKQEGSTYSKPRVILYRGDIDTDFDFQGIYRSSILVVDDIYNIYYSAINKGASMRSMALTVGRDIDKLIGVNIK